MWRKFTRVDTITTEEVEPWGTPFHEGLMYNARFESLYTKAGCGGEYAGHAIGQLDEDAKATPEILASARRLYFNRCDGHFYDRKTSYPLRRVSVLILRPGLTALYIP